MPPNAVQKRPPVVYDGTMLQRTIHGFAARLARGIHVLLALSSLLGLAAPAIASCGPHPLTADRDVRPRGNAMLIVTHATSFHDARLASKRGTDEAIRFARNKRMPIVYLQDDSPPELYFMNDCAPDYWVASQGGEIGFPVTTDEVFVAGGHLELCLSGTVHDIIYSWAQQRRRKVTLTYFMDAIYSNGKSVEPSDRFYTDFSTFMRVVTYGRPAGEHWPKLTLLETLGTINAEVDERAYLERVLPRWERTFPAEYRVELQLNNSVVKVLRSAPGWNPPTVRFHFVDSATTVDDVPLP